jgi:hypothetical protein
MTITGAILVFLAIFISDIFWVKCVQSVNNENAFSAALWAIGIFLPTAFGTVAYVHNPWLLIPACLGHGLGTFTAVWWNKAKREGRLKKMLDNYDWSRHSTEDHWK